jgi:hypothetical protein
MLLLRAESKGIDFLVPAYWRGGVREAGLARELASKRGWWGTGSQAKKVKLKYRRNNHKTWEIQMWFVSFVFVRVM